MKTRKLVTPADLRGEVMSYLRRHNEPPHEYIGDQIAGWALNYARESIASGELAHAEIGLYPGWV